MANHLFTHRSSILGLPIGPREPDWATVFGSTLTVAAAVGTLKLGLAIRERVGRLKKRLAAPLQEGKELVHEGETLVHDATELAHAVSSVGHAVSSAGGLVGKAKRPAA